MGNDEHQDVRFENLYLDGLLHGGRISWSRKNIKVIRAFCARNQVSDRNLPTPKLFLELLSDLNVHERIKHDRECFHRLAQKILNCIRQYVSKCKDMEGLSERRTMDGKYECIWYKFTEDWADPNWNGDISAPHPQRAGKNWVSRPMIPQRMPGVGPTQLIRQTWTKICDEEQAAAKLKQKGEAEDNTAAIPSENVDIEAEFASMDLINRVLERMLQFQASEYIKGMSIASSSAGEPAKPSSPVQIDSVDHTGEAQGAEAVPIDLKHIKPTLDLNEVVKWLGRDISDWYIGFDGFAGAKKADSKVQVHDADKPVPMEDRTVAFKSLSPKAVQPVQETLSKAIEPIREPAVVSDAEQAKRRLTAETEQQASQVQPLIQAPPRPSVGPRSSSESPTSSPTPSAKNLRSGAFVPAVETEAAEGEKKTSRSKFPVVRKNKDAKEKAEKTTTSATPASVEIPRTPRTLLRKNTPDAMTPSPMTPKAPPRISRYRNSSAMLREPVVEGSSKGGKDVVEDCEESIASDAEEYWMGGTI